MVNMHPVCFKLSLLFSINYPLATQNSWRYLQTGNFK